MFSLLYVLPVPSTVLETQPTVMQKRHGNTDLEVQKNIKNTETGP